MYGVPIQKGNYGVVMGMIAISAWICLSQMLKINIFAIIRRGGRGKRVMIGIIIEENVYNYGLLLKVKLHFYL